MTTTTTNTTTDTTTATAGDGRPATAARWFTGGHPLAGAAGRRCGELHGPRPWWAEACGACWEHAIRADAVLAVQEGLPSQPPPVDPFLIDPVAVERACSGDPVPLTGAELLVAVLRLRAAGVSFPVIGERLGRNPDALVKLARSAARRAGVAA